MRASHAPEDEFFFSSASPDAGEAAGAAAQDESSLLVKRVMNLLRGRWHWVILLGVVFGGGFAALGFYLTPLEYVATGQIAINETLPGATDPDQRTGYSGRTFLTTEMELLKSPDVLNLAVQDEVWLNTPGSEEIGAGTLGGAITTWNLPNTRLVMIQLVHEDPDIATAGLQAVMNAHKREFAYKYRAVDAAKLRTLERRQSELRAELLGAQRARAELLGERTVRVLQLTHDNLFRRVQQFEQALEEIKLAIARLGGAGDDAGLSNYSVEQLARVDAVIAGLSERRAELEYGLEVLRNSGIGDGHRRVRTAENEIEIIENQIASRADLLRSGTITPEAGGRSGDLIDNATLEELEKQRELVAEELAQQEARLAAAGRQLNEIKSLDTTIAGINDRIGTLEGQIDQVAGDEIGEHIEQIRIPDGAFPYNTKKRVMQAGLGGFLGAGLGLGVMVLFGFADRRFRHIGDAELDLPRVLGSLPSIPEKSGDPEQSILVAHSVHHIRTMLQIAGRGQNRVFAVTSPSRESGKTSLTMALGLSFASAGSKTLLIDADLVGGGLTRRLQATVHERLGRILVAKGVIDEPALEAALDAQRSSGERIGETLIKLGHLTREQHDRALEQQKQSSVGLLEVFGGKDLASCVAPTNLEHLDVLPIGTAMPHQAGTLSPAAFKRMVAAVRQNYDTVLIDTGPLLASLEASMAVAESDGAVLIVARGERRGLVDKCVSHFERLDAALVGVVFNYALDDDIERSGLSKNSVSVGRSDRTQSLRILDPEIARRYGPLASAVASYGPDTTRQPSNGHLTASA